jgi:Rod binding domain-containing protein
MNPINGIGAIPSLSATDKPQNLEQAASAFEALFLGNLLKAAREAREGGALGEGDQAGGSMMDMAEEFLAQEISRGGGCGLARIITERMNTGSGGLQKPQQ